MPSLTFFAFSHGYFLGRRFADHRTNLHSLGTKLYRSENATVDEKTFSWRLSVDEDPGGSIVVGGVQDFLRRVFGLFYAPNCNCSQFYRNKRTCHHV